MFLEQFPTDGRPSGWIEVICGSMFSGKTEELIRRIKRAEFANQRILLIKPSIDNRYSEGEIVSHSGLQVNAIVVENSKSIMEQWNGEQIVAIDEAQFFDAYLIDVCNSLANKGVRVVVAGLDMDYKGKPFGPIPSLMAIAEYVTKVHAICVACGNLAQFSHRFANETSQVLVGAVEKYKPLCRNCYNKYQLPIE
ncbi:MAG TPA: thymidine kinase [Taishania sp.]|nr:thymidine kinase [Taishania sp.]